MVGATPTLELVFQLQRPVDDLFYLRRRSRQTVLKRLSLQQFHYDEPAITVFGKVIYRADVGMVQPRGRPRLTPIEDVDTFVIIRFR
jgi:hypothetical protein